MASHRPCIASHHHRGQKLSKIETLRLARNYLILLTEMVCYNQNYSDLVAGQILAYGLGQQSLNQLAVLLNINGSIRILSQPSAQVRSIFAKYNCIGAIDQLNCTRSDSNEMRDCLDGRQSASSSSINLR